MEQTDKSRGLVRIVRLSNKADKLLRKRLERKGDVSRIINQAVLSTNLRQIEVERRDNAPGSGREDFFNTSVVFEPSIYEKAMKAAAAKKVSATVVIDTAVINFLSKGKPVSGRSVKAPSIKPKRTSN